MVGIMCYLSLYMLGSRGCVGPAPGCEEQRCARICLPAGEPAWRFQAAHQPAGRRRLDAPRVGRGKQ